MTRSRGGRSLRGHLPFERRLTGAAIVSPETSYAAWVVVDREPLPAP